MKKEENEEGWKEGKVKKEGIKEVTGKEWGKGGRKGRKKIVR